MAVASTLSACTFIEYAEQTFPARADRMLPPRVEINYAANSPWLESIALGQVSGGKIWPKRVPPHTPYVGNHEVREALLTTLKSNGLLADSPNKAKWILDIFIIDVSGPSIGLNLNAHAYMRYKITNIINKKNIYNEIIKSSFLANEEDAFYGIERRRIANEGDIRKNISNFLIALKKFETNNNHKELQ